LVEQEGERLFKIVEQLRRYFIQIANNLAIRD